MGNVKQIVWAVALSHLAPELIDAIERRPHHVACPVHGGKDGLRCFNDFNETGGMVCNTCGTFPNGFKVLSWVKGWTLAHATSAVHDCAGGRITKNNVIPFPPKSVDLLKKYHSVLNESLPLTDAGAEIARQYLENRGLSLEDYPQSVRFHPNLPYYEDRVLVQHFPALISVLTKGDNLVNLHRTYLDPDGKKAPVTSKKLMQATFPGAARGSCVKLYTCTSELAIAEGLETALAVHIATEMPVWATMTATLMPHVEIPYQVQFVDIWADYDVNKTGQSAANKLKQRLIREGRQCRILLPNSLSPDQSLDWLDVLLAT